MGLRPVSGCSCLSPPWVLSIHPCPGCAPLPSPQGSLAEQQMQPSHSLNSVPFTAPNALQISSHLGTLLSHPLLAKLSLLGAYSWACLSWWHPAQHRGARSSRPSGGAGSAAYSCDLGKGRSPLRPSVASSMSYHCKQGSGKANWAWVVCHRAQYKPHKTSSGPPTWTPIPVVPLDDAIMCPGGLTLKRWLGGGRTMPSVQPSLTHARGR